MCILTPLLFAMSVQAAYNINKYNINKYCSLQGPEFFGPLDFLKTQTTVTFPSW